MTKLRVDVGDVICPRWPLVGKKVLLKFPMWHHLFSCWLPSTWLQYSIQCLVPYLKATEDFHSFHYFHKVCFNTGFPCQKAEPEIPASSVWDSFRQVNFLFCSSKPTDFLISSHLNNYGSFHLPLEKLDSVICLKLPSKDCFLGFATWYLEGSLNCSFYTSNTSGRGLTY